MTPNFQNQADEKNDDESEDEGHIDGDEGGNGK